MRKNKGGVRYLTEQSGLPPQRRSRHCEAAGRAPSQSGYDCLSGCVAERVERGKGVRQKL